MLSFAVDLLSNASATGSAVNWAGGKGNFAVVGTFSGATVKLQALGPDGTTYIDVPNASLTAAGMALFELPAGQVKAVVTGGTSPSGLYAKAARVPV